MPGSLFRMEHATVGIKAWTKLDETISVEVTQNVVASRVLHARGLSSHQDFPHRIMVRIHNMVVITIICAYELGLRDTFFGPWRHSWSAVRRSVISKDPKIFVATVDCCYAERTPKCCLFDVPFRILARWCTTLTGFVVLWSPSPIFQKAAYIFLSSLHFQR
jgi:hypothetical protein